ncbi:substrate-binding domain-containing protein [Actinokineospora sp. HUAS TT18]|uniref:substrate-binding domain-containing protein n=1 Tax=Actinokineospora sp. HUAS TT18 TaxID=3447451 RepID=UPI003F527E2D
MRKLAAVVALALALTACSENEGNPISPAEPGKLRILAGSELADLKPVLDKAAETTGVRVEFTFSGTIEGAQALASGSVDSRYDAVWFSSNRYLEALPEAGRRLGNQTKIMASPVVLGIAESKAKALGWADKPVTWADIATAAGTKSFSYGMTDPSSSNSGFSALVGVASALAGTGSAISADQIAKVTPDLKKFFTAQAMSAGSSGWLSEAYQRRATGGDPGEKIDGLINYESVLLTLNTQLPEKLKLIYPTDGVVTADYPLTLLASANDAARGDHQKLGDYLRGADAQKSIMESSKRRPVVPGVALSGEFGQQSLVELPFPAKQEAFDALLSAYFDQIRKPSRTLYVLDTSGSMSGDRIEALRAAVTGLTGASDDLVGRYRKFRGREEVTLLPFNSGPGQPTTFTIPETGQDAELERIREFARGLKANGGTAIYDSLDAAYAALGSLSPDKFTSIVLMTDGENSNGSDIDTWERKHQSRKADLKRVPVFSVVFGEGDKSELERVATATGGRVFDARDGALSDVFREIRGYQ